MNMLSRYSLVIILSLVCTAFQTLATQSSFSQQLVKSARKQIGLTRYYDPTYQALKYPAGDVSLDRGVCTDVIIRALREQGIDLQKEINQHMQKHWKAYPKKWGLSKPDPNIDHRRVPNILTYFKLKNCLINLDAPYLPGDIVVWDLGNGVLHIGLMSDTRIPQEDRYMVIHNICCGVKEEDILTSYKIVAHFRVKEELLKRTDE